LSAVPAQAQFGGLRDAADLLRGLAKKKTRTAPPTGSNDSSADEEQSPAIKALYNRTPPPKPVLTQLPEEFRKASQSLGSPELSEANIRRLILRDIRDVVEIKKLVILRNPGPLWTISGGNGPVTSLRASSTTHLYARLSDGKCGIYLYGSILDRPSQGFGNGFGEVQAVGVWGEVNEGVSCNLK
jgi:hypothetical protein